MTGFTLILQDATHRQQFEGVSSFVGEDSSGSFGLLPGHTRMMTLLVMGLSRFRVGDQPWRYLATPGALCYFHQNCLNISTRHFLIDDNYMKISKALQQQLLDEETQLRNQKSSLRQMEETVLKYLWELGKMS